jgi:hypothetical protein
MSPSARLLVALTVLASAAAAAVPGPDEKELAANRRLFEDYRRDPAHYERLKRDWRAFKELPAEKRARMRQLDFQLRQEDAETQTRLLRVLERYVTWLERLSDEDRQRVESAGGADERLRVIQEIRANEWLSRQPKAVRELVQKAAPDKRAALLKEERQKELRRRQEWQQSIPRRSQYTQLTKFSPEVQKFVQESLSPLLTEREKQQLDNAKGKNNYGAILADLIDRHPIKLPPSPTIGPRNHKELKELGKRLPRNQLDSQQLKEVEGKWPDFARYVHDVVRDRKIRMAEWLGPCRPGEFTLAVQQFIAEELLPRLTPEEKDRLEKAEGKWPDYPDALMELAQKHQLAIPGMALPESREFWDALRFRVP